MFTQISRFRMGYGLLRFGHSTYAVFTISAQRRQPDGLFACSPTPARTQASLRWIMSELRKLLAISSILLFHRIIIRWVCPTGWTALDGATIYAELSTAKRMDKFNMPFVDWRKILPLLPDGAVMDLAPLKFGELWMVWPAGRDDQHKTLVVCEGFFNFPKEIIKGATWVPVKVFDNGPGLQK